MVHPSQYYHANKMGRIIFESIQELIGTDALYTMLREQGLEKYTEAFPPDNLKREFDFADFSAVLEGVDILQARQPRTPLLAHEVGVRCYAKGLKTFGSLSGFGAVAVGFQALPINLKVKMGLLTMVTIFTTLSDQLSDLEDNEDHYAYVIKRCPVCMGRHSDVPICTTAGALIEAGLQWLTQSRYSVVETACLAVGDKECRFVINKTPLSQAHPS